MRTMTPIVAFLISLLVPLAAAYGQQVVSLTILPEWVELTRSTKSQPYQAELELVVVGVGDVPFHPVQLSLGIAGKKRARLILEFDDDLTVTSDRPWHRKVTLPGQDPAMWVATLSGRTATDEPVRIQQTFRVHNTDLKNAQAECRSCNGQWGRFGMLGWEGCNCRTPDAGRRCIDGRDCQGRCLFESFEVVEEASAPLCDEQGECRASLGVRRAIGACSEFRYVYGCHSIIPDGASHQPPASGAWRTGQVCAD